VNSNWPDPFRRNGLAALEKAKLQLSAHRYASTAPGMDLIVPDITKACPMFFPWTADTNSP
jgi:hypothetical protein